jgi:hypothetical protein
LNTCRIPIVALICSRPHAQILFFNTAVDFAKPQLFPLPNTTKETQAAEEVNRIMVAAVAAATFGSIPIASIRGPLIWGGFFEV